jgi:hypothetical protein
MLVQKKYIPHMKALILSYLESRDKGVAYPWGPHAHIPSKLLYLFFLRSWRPCEVDEVKK